MFGGTGGSVDVQYQDLEQQTHAAHLGMWAFMASEVLFFSGLFALFTAYRLEYGDAFREAARHTSLVLGSTDTFVLLTSSLLVVLSLGAIKEGRSPIMAVRYLWSAHRARRPVPRSQAAGVPRSTFERASIRGRTTPTAS